MRCSWATHGESPISTDLSSDPRPSRTWWLGSAKRALPLDFYGTTNLFLSDLTHGAALDIDAARNSASEPPLWWLAVTEAEVQQTEACPPWVCPGAAIVCAANGTPQGILIRCRNVSRDSALRIVANATAPRRAPT
ncbi:hypothetical protein BURKHO8Y_470002 [Burkholderia sp. 8Y]|nr:hypothetical protein BURKHO8Y_470002 [Burkholderia sp. 8Y]